MMKWSRKSTAAEYDHFKMRRSEIRKLKNENSWGITGKREALQGYKQAWTLQLFFEQVDEKLSNQITCDHF